MVSSKANAITSDVFYQKRADIAYNRTTTSGTNLINIYWSDDDFEFAPNDEERVGVDLNIGYNFSDAYSAGIFGNYEKSEFLNIDRIDKDRTVALGFVYWHTRRLAFSLEGESNVRESTGISRGEGYREKRAILTVSYNRRTRFSRALGVDR